MQLTFSFKILHTSPVLAAQGTQHFCDEYIESCFRRLWQFKTATQSFLWNIFNRCSFTSRTIQGQERLNCCWSCSPERDVMWKQTLKTKIPTIQETQIEVYKMVHEICKYPPLLLKQSYSFYKVIVATYCKLSILALTFIRTKKWLL